MACYIFLSFCRLSSHFVEYFLCRCFLVWCSSTCLFCFFVACALDVICVKSLARSMPWSVPPFLMGFFDAMMERGLQPGDFHITGLGNMESWGFTPLGTPKLTTTHHPREPYLGMAVQMLCRQIREKSNVAEIIRIPGELILRESAFYKKINIK